MIVRPGEDETGRPVVCVSCGDSGPRPRPSNPYLTVNRHSLPSARHVYLICMTYDLRVRIRTTTTTTAGSLLTPIFSSFLQNKK